MDNYFRKLVGAKVNSPKRPTLKTRSRFYARGSLEKQLGIPTTIKRPSPRNPRTVTRAAIERNKKRYIKEQTEKYREKSIKWLKSRIEELMKRVERGYYR
jgi:hypothetical protein